MALRRGTTTILLCATLLASELAVAQERSLTLAEQAFREGKALMDEKKYAEACPKLAASFRADPQIGTLLNLALCHEAEGKTASAWGEFAEAASLASRQSPPQAERAAFANERVKALEAQLSMVRFKVERPATGQSLKLDGKAIEEAMWTGVPLDPGAHDLEVAAPGKKTWTKAIVVGGGPSTTDVPIPALEDAPVAATSTGETRTDGRADTRDDTGKDTKTLGFVLGGVGIAGIGVGAVFGLMTLGKASEIKEACPGPSGSACPTAKDHETYDAAKRSGETFGLVSTAGFIVGGLGLAAGAYFILTSKPPAEHRTAAAQTSIRLAPAGGPGAAGMRLEGTF